MCYAVPLEKLVAESQAWPLLQCSRFFKGCGGNPPSQLNYIEVRNYRQSSESLCIDRVVLV